MSPLPALRLPWPLPALLAWAGAWALFMALRGMPGLQAWALPAGLLAGAAWAWPPQSGWRRLIIAGGFPLSALATGLAAGLPAWTWLLPLALLALAYPLRAWRDAPLYPTPPDALAELPARLKLPRGACLLDAGCGLGHGLQALRAAWPEAHVEGIEWSRLLRWLAAWRCRFARVRRGDMWRLDWSGYDLVYLFQRPESMARALAKAEREMPRGAWLVSLAFEVPGAQPQAVLRGEGMRSLWLYRIGENKPFRSITGEAGR